jgi:predicted secreted Zn-dependent protease
MRPSLLFALMLAFAAAPASAANLAKSYSYFSIGGSTLDEIENQLSRRGPEVKGTGHRHPGATRMAFTTRLGYGGKPGSCRIVSAEVTVKVKIILPKWRHPRKADADVRLFWYTLASDIKRHEESHVVIAKNHARKLEDALKASGRQPDCATAKAKAKEITARILAEHDRAQERFDRVELINFQSRMLRLLRYRMEQIAAGR